jgi:phosphoserine phosphatase
MMTGSMRATIVVTGAPGRVDVTEALMAIVARESCSDASAIRILGRGVAAECVTQLGHDQASGDLLARLRLMPEAARVDVNVVAQTERRKHLLIADMDSTIIEQECIDEMADELGIKPEIAEITERAMRGELDFEAALKQRLSLLRGLDEAALERVYTRRVTLMPGAKTLIATMRAHGAYTALVSGGFTFFTGRVARAVGFDVNRANQLGFADGRLTGAVVGPILGKAAKLAALQEFAQWRGLPQQATLAVGDGANDLDMIRAAGLGVAYRAKPVVAAEAAASITHGDLTALLYLQGYSSDAFVNVP